MLKAAVSVGSVAGSSPGFPTSASDIPIVEDQNVAEDLHWDLRYLTSEYDRRPSALQRVEEHYQTYGIFVPFDVKSVQKVVKDALAASKCWL